jgi:hypothetical protein
VRFTGPRLQSRREYEQVTARRDSPDGGLAAIRERNGVDRNAPVVIKPARKKPKPAKPKPAAKPRRQLRRHVLAAKQLNRALDAWHAEHWAWNHPPDDKQDVS